MDVHKNQLTVAILCPSQGSHIETFKIGNNGQSISKLCKRLHAGAPGDILLCYEAGCLSYSLQRVIEYPGEVRRYLEGTGESTETPYFAPAR